MNCVNSKTRKIAISLLLISIFVLQLFSAEKKSPQNLAIIIQKNVFFTDLEKKQEKSLPVFIKQISSPQPLDKNYVLTGTFVFLDEPEKTTAVLKEISTNKMLFLKKGDIISGSRIISIDDNGVVFESGFGEKCTLTHSGLKFSQQQLQTFYFSVNLKLAFETIGLEPEILSTINISPADPSTGGFKIQDIKPGSIFESAGLAINDIIIQIDDTILKVPDDAITAYKKILMTGKNFATIRILRNKKPVNLVYICE